jgi:MFS family permease
VASPEPALRVGIPHPGPSFRGALQTRDFSLLFAGQLGSEVGNGLVQLALPLLVLDITNSAFSLGVAYFIQFLPMLLFGILGGVLVDRWDRRVTIIVVDVIRGFAFLSVGLIYYFDALFIEHLYAVIFVEAVLANFFNPARAALMPNLVSPENLRPANSLMEVSRHIGFLVAPPVGAVFSDLLGPAALMLTDGGTFLASAVTIAAIRWRPPTRERVTADGIRHNVALAVDQTKEGMRAILRSRILQAAIALGFSLNLVVAPIQVLLPLFVREVKQAADSAFGLLVAGLLLGLIIGSLAAPAVARRVGLGRMAAGSIVLLGAVIASGAWPPSIWIPFGAMIVAGLCIGSLNVSQTTMLQSATTDDERGRVSATYYTATLGVRPIAFLTMGALAERVSIRVLFLALGLTTMAIGLGISRLHEVREAR